MQLLPGIAAPRQSTPTTCGSACLVVARMLRDPAFARWVDDGDAGGRVALAGSTAADRFASYEVLVKGRTVGPRGLRGLQLPWPGSLGTPPWGALGELAALSGERVRDQRVDVLRGRPAAQRIERLRALEDLLTPGRSALLYVGSRGVPRHVCLVARPDAASGLVVYEPSAGEVCAFDPEALGSDTTAPGHQSLGGWPIVWCVVRPR